MCDTILRRNTSIDRIYQEWIAICAEFRDGGLRSSGFQWKVNTLVSQREIQGGERVGIIPLIWNGYVRLSLLMGGNISAAIAPSLSHFLVRFKNPATPHHYYFPVLFYFRQNNCTLELFFSSLFSPQPVLLYGFFPDQGWGGERTGK